MIRPYEGQSSEEWEHVVAPEDEPEPEDYGRREDDAYDRMVQMQMDGEL